MPSVRVAAQFEIGGDNWEFTSALATGSKDWAAVGSAFNTAVIDNLLPSLGSDCMYMGSQWSDVIEKEVLGEFVAAPADSLGGAGLSLPPEVAATITLVIPAYGRGKQGRWFISGIPQEAQAVGELDPAFRETFQTGVTAFQGALADASIVVLVAHYDHTVTPAVFVGTDIVSRLNVRTILRGQKRRQHGRSIGAHPSLHRTP